ALPASPLAPSLAAQAAGPLAGIMAALALVLSALTFAPLPANSAPGALTPTAAPTPASAGPTQPAADPRPLPAVAPDAAETLEAAPRSPLPVGEGLGVRSGAAPPAAAIAEPDAAPAPTTEAE